MYEIELKAHINDYIFVEKKLNSFATFFGKCEKSDVYWQQIAHPSGKPPIVVRIRTQKKEAPNGKISCDILVTYKQKEIHYAQSDNSKKTTAYEVNKEEEFTINDTKPFEAILHDAGFKIILKKHKTAMQWKYDEVLLELCTIHGLGDFLELEIMSDDNSTDRTKAAHHKLKSLLIRCNIPLKYIEPKYYSALLKERSLDLL